jgi:hypothetical protein
LKKNPFIERRIVGCGQTDVTDRHIMLTVVFCNLVNVPKNVEYVRWSDLHRVGSVGGGEVLGLVVYTVGQPERCGFVSNRRLS